MGMRTSGPRLPSTGPAEFDRRTLLKVAGAALPRLVIFRGRAHDTRNRHQEFRIDIKRFGSQPSAKGPAEWFTGTVRIDPLFQSHDPAPAAGASVTFEPGARTAWHTHPLGQT